MDVQGSQANARISTIDFSKYGIDTQVEDALRLAIAEETEELVNIENARLDDRRLNASTWLKAVLSAKGLEGSKSFSKWVSYFPPEETRVSPRARFSGRLDEVGVDGFLKVSFEIAEPFLATDHEIWGRDYITIGLLADDPALEELAERAGRNLSSLRDEWFRFVTGEKRRTHRRWVDWWTAAGIGPPGTRAPTEPEDGIQDDGVAPEAFKESPLGVTQESEQGVEGVQPLPRASTPTPAPAPRRPDVWMLSDRPLEANFAELDRFGFKDYADALATVIDHEKTETPFTMAINAPWGAGKSTLANMVAEQLRERPRLRGSAPHIICWFNAWINDDAPNLATAIVSEVARVANRNRTWFIRILRPLPTALLTPAGRNLRRAFMVAVILCVTLWVSGWLGRYLDQIEKERKQSPQTTTVTETTDQITKKVTTTVTAKAYAPYQELPKDATPTERWIARFQSQIVILGAFFTALAGLLGILVKVFPPTALEGFVKAPEKAAETGVIQAAAKQLKVLIRQATWRRNRFIVFVDDIERCTPPRSIEVLDAVNQMMSHAGVVIVFLGDMSAVAASAQLKYKDLAEIFVPSAGIAVTGPDRGREAFGRLYLQKIIQFQFDLPVPPMARIQEYMRKLAATPAAHEGGDG
jgi:hypothetical protein